jgi:hypothetical protein
MYLCCGRWRSSSSALITAALCASHARTANFRKGLLGQQSRVGFCARCRRSLASDSGKDESERYSALRQETPEWEIWVANQVARLIEAGLHDPPLLTREQLSELIRTATDIVGLNKFARMLGVSATAVYEWQIRGVQPTFVLYLRVARVLNVPLADLLTGRVMPARIHSLCLVDVPHWRNVWVRPRSAFNSQDAARQMDAALTEIPPPSLMAFAKRHGYSHGILRKYLPEQCRAIQQRYREHTPLALNNGEPRRSRSFGESPINCTTMGRTYVRIAYSRGCRCHTVWSMPLPVECWPKSGKW